MLLCRAAGLRRAAAEGAERWGGHECKGRATREMERLLDLAPKALASESKQLHGRFWGAASHRCIVVSSSSGSGSVCQL